MTRFYAEDRAKMESLRNAGWSLGEIAKHFSTSRQLVHNYTAPLTLDVQVAIRTRRLHEVMNARADLWSAHEDRELVDLWMRWKSIAKIAASRRINRTYAAIERRVRDKGLRERFSTHVATGSPITLPFVSILASKETAA